MRVSKTLDRGSIPRAPAKKGLLIMMFMGFLTIVILPMFLFVSARVLSQGLHKGEPLTKIGAAILYIMAAVCAISGLILVLDII